MHRQSPRRSSIKYWALISRTVILVISAWFVKYGAGGQKVVAQDTAFVCFADSRKTAHIHKYPAGNFLFFFLLLDVEG